MEIRHFVAAVILASAAFAAPAMATYSSGAMSNAVNSTVVARADQIKVFVDGDTVTLTGYADMNDAIAAEHAAISAPGINKVYNYVEYRTT